MDAKHYQIQKRFEAEESKLDILANCVYKLLCQQEGDEWGTLRYKLDEAFDFQLTEE